MIGLKRILWTQEDSEALAHGYLQGLTFRQIETKLRGKYSRGAIAGRAKRLGLCRSASC